ncbi:unnamed protein product [Caenorhabditis auriculariae]|uniref:N-acetylphosphatidylethanolamine-hydrolyzing phospholipase D n=1 Tax=Caenorhabditis auriculariae TaxID=2777116 RepID=A0A8S1HJH5_9PELO|nr:unnamed protein product [Caenorhabditis auriculariae]
MRNFILLSFGVFMCGRTKVMSAPAASTSSESEKEFAKPLISAGSFANPPSFDKWGGLPGLKAALKWRLFEKDLENVPSDSKELDKTIPVHQLTKFESKNVSSKLFASWLGHATVLVNLEGAKFITDPIWAERASFLSFAGPKRYRPPPMDIEDLPQLDFAVISHDHYDHLDADAVKKITEMSPNIQWFVPLGMQGWMKTIGISNSEEHPHRVKEMNWGEHTEIRINDQNFTIWCVPAQHWGQRGPLDRNRRLWAGWAVVGPSRRFYYSGDTGNCDKEFRKIGQKLGPFDLAAIPIGAYEPNWFMKSQHINPEEAVGMHEMIRSKMSIGIHWGTYHMGSYEFYLEPREKLKSIMEQRTDLPKFITIEQGTIWEEDSEESHTNSSSFE